jgi:hypothetical protein
MDRTSAKIVEDHWSMERSVLYVVLAVLIIGIGIGGFAWYDHKRNTLLEVDVGTHGVSVQKN